MNRQQRRAAGRARPDSGFTPATPEQLRQAIVIAQAGGQVGLAELLRAVLARKVALAWLWHRATLVTPAELGHARLPTVILIGDDDENPTGPAGWACAKMVSAHVAAAVIHGAGATAESYAEASYAAQQLGSCALIETASRCVEAWRDLFDGKTRLVIVPSEGGVHPTGFARETRH